jgi:hypothetical protein
MEEKEGIMENLDNADVTSAEEVISKEAKTSPTERMKGMDRFKDKEYESQEQALADALDVLEETMPQSQEAEKIKKDMTDLFKKHPEIIYLIKVAEETGDFHTAIQSLYDNDEDMLMREGDEGYDNLKKIRGDRIEKSNAEQELLDKYNANMESFPARYDAWAEQNGLTDEDKDGLYAFLESMLPKLITGDLDEEILDKMYQAYSYKRDLGDLEEDKAIATANVENAKSKPAAPVMPIPEGTSPAVKPDIPKEKVDPLTEVYENEMKKKNFK